MQLKWVKPNTQRFTRESRNFSLQNTIQTSNDNMDLVVYCHYCDNYRFNSVHDDRRCYPLPKRCLTLLSDVEFDCFNRWNTAIYLPWRRWIGFSANLKEERSKFIQETKIIEPEWEPEGFEGGWFEAGKIEISLLFGAILLGVIPLRSMVQIIDSKQVLS